MINGIQTCAFGGAMLMAGTIAAMQRLSAEYHLGLFVASVDPIYLLYYHGMLQLVIIERCTINTLPRQENSSIRLQLTSQADLNHCPFRFQLSFLCLQHVTRYTLYFVTNVELQCTKYFIQFALFSLLFIVFPSNYPIYTIFNFSSMRLVD